MDIRNRDVASIARSQYTHVNNRNIRGIFETADDDWFLVSSVSLDKLLFESTCISDMTLEEAEERYGDEIVKQYLQRQAQERMNRRLGTLKSINSQREEGAKARKLQVLTLILQGYSKDEITEATGIARGTIDKHLRGLDNDEFMDLYTQNQAGIFADVPYERVEAFIAADCIYKKFRKSLLN